MSGRRSLLVLSLRIELGLHTERLPCLRRVRRGAPARCYAEHWGRPSSANGNGDAARRRPSFPNLRIAGCESCRRYLIEVDMSRDGRAVPEVDELAAVPLDLYAADQGLTKVTPNLMGF